MPIPRDAVVYGRPGVPSGTLAPGGPDTPPLGLGVPPGSVFVRSASPDTSGLDLLESGPVGRGAGLPTSPYFDTGDSGDLPDPPAGPREPGDPEPYPFFPGLTPSEKYPSEGSLVPGSVTVGCKIKHRVRYYQDSVFEGYAVEWWVKKTERWYLFPVGGNKVTTCYRAVAVYRRVKVTEILEVRSGPRPCPRTRVVQRKEDTLYKYGVPVGIPQEGGGLGRERCYEEKFIDTGPDVGEDAPDLDHLIDIVRIDAVTSGEVERKFRELLRLEEDVKVEVGPAKMSEE